MANIKTLYKNTDFEPLVVLEKILDFAYKSDSFETGNLIKKEEVTCEP